MSSDVIQYAFVAGEISEKLLGRTDFEKYDLGLRQAKNWFVDYRGGLTTRPGFEFCEWTQNPTTESKMFPFQFSPETSNTYVVLFQEGKIRFIQAGGYVLETPITITSMTNANPGVFTRAAHGYSTGDLVYVTGIVGPDELNGAVYEVNVTSGSTYNLVDQFGDLVDTSALAAYVGSGTTARVYTVTHSYATADIPQLQAKQIGDYLRLTHPGYKVQNLIRSAHTTWTLENEDFLDINGSVSGVTPVPSAAGSAGAVYAVTWHDSEGNESYPAFGWERASVDFTVTAGFMSITWDRKAGATKYTIYRTRVLADADELNWAMEFGYLGTAFGNKFVDNNVVPDFTQTPPTHRDPFSPGQIASVTITNDGAGYDALSNSVTMTGGGGTGFVGRAVVVDGEVQSVRIISPGRNFTSTPTVVFNGVGAGAVGTAVLTDTSGCFPITSTVFQQRQIYAGTEDNPLRIFGSRPGRLNNFDDSDIITDDCAFEFDIDSLSVSPIKHLLPVRGGLLAMSEVGIWLLSGETGRALTPTNAVADPQTFVGVSDVEPLTIDTELLYVTAKEASVRLLSYNDFSKIYGGQDMSILSSHLFSVENPIIRWTYAEAPYRMLTAVRQDGSFLHFAIVKEQNVFAWTPGETQGVITDCVTVSEDGQDRTYITVKRYLNGEWVRFIERVADREAANVNNAEDAICLDSALTLGGTFPSSTLSVPSVGEPGEALTITSGSAVMGSSVGKIIRVGGGKFRVTVELSTSSVTAICLRPITDVIPGTDDPRPFVSGEWTLDTPVTVIQGLQHLEGQTVSVLGDGNVLPSVEVVNGTITLSASVTRATIGLPYTCIAKTLPIVSTAAIIEGRRKRIYGMAIRRYQSRGLKVGTHEDVLWPMAERTDEINGEPTRLQSDMRYEVVDGVWDIETGLVMVQDVPLPCSILGFTQDMDVGDDKG